MTHILIQWNTTHKIKWNVPICDNMNGPRGYHAKWNKLDRERQIPYDLTYMWNLKQKSNRLTDTENKLVVTRRQGNEGWVKQVKMIKLYKFPGVK